MNMKIIAFITSFILMSSGVWGQDHFQVIIPPHIYCNQHADISMYYDHFIYAPGSGGYIFKVSKNLGTEHPDKFTFDIRKKKSRDYHINVRVYDRHGLLVGKEKTTLHYSNLISIPEDTVKILIIGNSLTAAGHYPAKVQSFMRDSVRYPVKFLGSKTSNGGIHEGYGGKTWKWFVHHGDSPFVFRTADNDSILDFGHYFTEVVHDTPDMVVIFLGINDCFRADTASVETIDKTIDEMLEESTFFLSKLIQYKTDLEIGICLTPPANVRETAFQYNYGDKYTRSGWEKIQRRLVERYITFFDGHFQSNCSLIPVEINIDTYNGYPGDNAVHPNVYGYDQIAASIFSWIYYRLD
jgi:hypothetical protein